MRGKESQTISDIVSLYRLPSTSTSSTPPPGLNVKWEDGLNKCGPSKLLNLKSSRSNSPTSKLDRSSLVNRVQHKGSQQTMLSDSAIDYDASVTHAYYDLGAKAQGRSARKKKVLLRMRSRSRLLGTWMKWVSVDVKGSARSKLLVNQCFAMLKPKMALSF